MSILIYPNCHCNYRANTEVQTVFRITLQGEMGVLRLYRTFRHKGRRNVSKAVNVLHQNGVGEINTRLLFDRNILQNK